MKDILKPTLKAEAYISIVLFQIKMINSEETENVECGKKSF